MRVSFEFTVDKVEKNWLLVEVEGYDPFWLPRGLVERTPSKI